MNVMNTKTLNQAHTAMAESVALLGDVLEENERLTAHFETVIKERDAAWTRNAELQLLDVENQQWAERCEKLVNRRAEAETERDSAQKLLLAATENRDSWASRFRGLEADMRGMESMLNDERARVKLHMEQNACHQQTIKDLTAERDAFQEECYAWRRQAPMTPTQIAGLNRDLEYVRGCNKRQAETIREKNEEIEGLTKSVATARVQTAQTALPAYFPVGTEVFVRNRANGAVFKRKVAKAHFEIASEGVLTPEVYYVLLSEGHTRYHSSVVFNTSEAAFK